VLAVEDWAEIRRLHRSEQMPIKAIARVMGVSKNTVKAALRSDGPPKYERPDRGSVVDDVEPRIRELLQAVPTMPATVIAERIGWDRSIRVLRDRVAELRPVYLPPDPASRTAYVAGEIAQFDLWFPPITLPVGFGQTRPATQLPVLTMVCGYSRTAAAVLIPSRTAEDLMAGWWQLIAALGAVPRVLVWDGEARSAGGGAGAASSPPSARPFAAPWPRRCSSAGRPIRRPRGWSSGCTTTSSGPSCPGGRSPARWTSTPRSAAGWRR
jgi:transposase